MIDLHHPFSEALRNLVQRGMVDEGSVCAGVATEEATTGLIEGDQRHREGLILSSLGWKWEWRNALK